MDGPDAADVVAAASGDTAAFERLVRTMQGPVWRYLVHLVGDGALAEDVSQEVFLRVHRKLHTLRDPDRFVPWLLAMARNAAYDAGRARKRRPVELVGDRELPSPEAEDPHLSVEVYDALERLDDSMREAVVLVTMIGLTYQEAADAIGVPGGTVKSRAFRARKVLMELLAVETSRRARNRSRDRLLVRVHVPIPCDRRDFPWARRVLSGGPRRFQDNQQPEPSDESHNWDEKGERRIAPVVLESEGHQH